MTQLKRHAMNDKSHSNTTPSITIIALNFDKKYDPKFLHVRHGRLRRENKAMYASFRGDFAGYNFEKMKPKISAQTH